MPTFWQERHLQQALWLLVAQTQSSAVNIQWITLKAVIMDQDNTGHFLKVSPNFIRLFRKRRLSPLSPPPWSLELIPIPKDVVWP